MELLLYAVLVIGGIASIGYMVFAVVRAVRRNLDSSS